jgi:hypothetical protein
MVIGDVREVARCVSDCSAPINMLVSNVGVAPIDDVLDAVPTSRHRMFIICNGNARSRLPWVDSGLQV